jgi:RNA polymerase sigma-70 factor (ECF subfamily)
MKRTLKIPQLTVDVVSDQALMARVVCREELALAELYDRFGCLVLAIALRITQDRVVAEEVVQDVFYAIWRTADSFQPARSVSAWITGIARHRAIDATRARGFRAREREQEMAPALELAAGDLPDEQVERRLAGEWVRAALRQLHPVQREALALAFYQGMSHSQIAAQTGIPLGTVKTRLRVGLLRLREELAAPA